jgi:hypothetical protein
MKARKSATVTRRMTKGVTPRHIGACRRAVAAHLRPRSARLIARLKKLIAHEYPDDFWRLDFEIEDDGAGADASIVAYFYRARFEQIYENDRDANRYPFSARNPLNYVITIGRLFPSSLLRKLCIGPDDFWHCYVAEEETIRWFERCWRGRGGAGGAKFPFQAVIGGHDTEERLNLITGKRIRDV